MKTNHIIFLLVFLAINIRTVAQSKYLTKTNSPNLYLREVYYVLKDNESQKFGPYQIYFDGKLIVEGQYFNNQKQGFWEKYYPSGQVCGRGQYQAGQKTGMWQHFYENSTISANYFFKNNKKHGTFSGFYPDGTPWAVLNYSNDTLLGEQVFYYPNGVIALYQTIEKTPIGLFIKEAKYYDDGKIFLEQQTINDTLDGNYIKYHKGGIIWEHFVYNKGVLLEVNQMKSPSGVQLSTGSFREGNGALFRYHGDGMLYSEEEYKNGLKNGIASYYLDKTLRIKAFFANSKPAGTWQYFNYSKKLEKERVFFEDGITIFEKIYGAAGKEMHEGSLKNYQRHGTWKSYNFYGELYTTCEYKYNQKHGSFKSYENGLLMQTGGYFYDEKVGNWKSYNRNGKVVYNESYTKQMMFDTTYVSTYSEDLAFEPKSSYTFVHEITLPTLEWPNVNHRNYVYKQLVLPQKAKDLKVFGTNSAYLEISELGVIDSIICVKDIGFGCKQEMERVLLTFPPFYPATRYGIPTKTLYWQNIHFGEEY